MAQAAHRELTSLIDQAMIRDRFRFRKDLHAKNKRDRLRQKITRSVELAERRRAMVPAPTFPEDLPVTEHPREIQQAIRNHQVVIVAGETGSGKTTQIPKICLGLGRGVTGKIGHTQPRRVAARTVSARIAEELGVRLGGEVGHQIRFTDETSDLTLIKVFAM